MALIHRGRAASLIRLVTTNDLAAGYVPEAISETPLAEALEETRQRNWAGRRCEEASLCQGRAAIKALQELGLSLVEEVTPAHLRAVVKTWQGAGKSVSTIRRRLSVLNCMGIAVQGTRPTLRPVVKWWLNAADRDRAATWLRSDPSRAGHRLRSDLADYIEWTYFTGLRVEESLRLRWREVQFHWEGGVLVPEKMSVTVPGLKTFGSCATLPLTREAAKVFLRRWLTYAERKGCPPRPDERVFHVDYRTLCLAWAECREFLGVKDNPLSTLKALRRSAARHLHVDKGMPLDLVRQYLRHGNVAITMEYLRLVGGYSTEEMRRWASQ